MKLPDKASAKSDEVPLNVKSVEGNVIAPEVASLIVFNSAVLTLPVLIVIAPDKALSAKPSNAAANWVAVPVKLTPVPFVRVMVPFVASFIIPKSVVEIVVPEILIAPVRVLVIVPESAAAISAAVPVKETLASFNVIAPFEALFINLSWGSVGSELRLIAPVRVFVIVPDKASFMSEADPLKVTDELGNVILPVVPSFIVFNSATDGFEPVIVILPVYVEAKVPESAAAISVAEPVSATE